MSVAYCHRCAMGLRCPTCEPLPGANASNEVIVLRAQLAEMEKQVRISNKKCDDAYESWQKTERSCFEAVAEMIKQRDRADRAQAKLAEVRTYVTTWMTNNEEDGIPNGELFGLSDMIGKP